MRRAVLAGTVATSLVAGAAAGVILGVPVTAQSGERLASSPKISIAAATVAAAAAAVPAAAAPAAPAMPADDAAPAAAPAAVPAAATAHAHVPTSLPATSLHASTGARAAAGTADAAGELLVVASTLHMALSDLRSALAAGKSLAQIATAAGIDPNKLIAAVVNDATAKINAAVSLGVLSRAEADKIIAMLPGLVTDVVNHTFGDIGAGFAPGSKLAETLGSLGKLASLGNFAKLGKFDGTGDFKSSFINMFGSFGNLGQANPGANIDPQALISSIVSMATDAVNAALSAGLLTQAQASTILAELTPAITSLVHTTLDASSNLGNQAAGWASLGSSWMAHLHH